MKTHRFSQEDTDSQVLKDIRDLLYIIATPTTNLGTRNNMSEIRENRMKES